MRRIKRIAALLLVLTLAVSMMPLLAMPGTEAYAEPLLFRMIGDGDLGVMTKGFSQADADSAARTIQVKYNGSESAILKVHVYAYEGLDITQLVNRKTIKKGQTMDIAVVKPETGADAGEWRGEIYAEINGEGMSTPVTCRVVNKGLSVFAGRWPDASYAGGSGLSLGSSVEGAELEHPQAGQDIFDAVNDGSENFTLKLSTENDLFTIGFADGEDPDRLIKSADRTRIRVAVNEDILRTKKAGIYRSNAVIKASSSDGRRRTVKVAVSFKVLPSPTFQERSYTESVSGDRMHTYEGRLYAYTENTTYIPYEKRSKYLSYAVSGEGLELVAGSYHPIVKLAGRVSETETGTYSGKVSMFYDPTGTGTFSSTPTDTADVSIEVWDSSAYRFEVFDGDIQLDTDNGREPDFMLGTLYEGYSAADAERLEKQIRLKNTGNGDLEFSTDSIRKDGEAANRFVFSSGGAYETVSPGSSYRGITVKPVTGLPVGIHRFRTCLYEKTGYATRYGMKSIVITVKVVRKGVDFDTLYNWKAVPKGGISRGTLMPGNNIYDWVKITNTGEYDLEWTAASDSKYLIVDDRNEGGSLPVGGERDIYFLIDTDGLANGSYSAKLNIRAAKPGSSTDVKELTIPVSFRVDDSRADVTVDLQGVGGLENLVKKDVPVYERTRNTAYEMMNGTDSPDVDGYIGLDLTEYPDSHYSSWQDYIDEIHKGEKYENMHVSDVQRLYYNWARHIKTDSITVTAPACGPCGDALPEVSIPGSSHWHVDRAIYYTENWQIAEKLEFGKSYITSVTLGSDWGYAFKSGRYRVNGSRTTCYTEGKGNKLRMEYVVLKITDHDWDDGQVMKPATVSVEGEKTFTCRHCGEMKTETISRLTPSGGSDPALTGGNDNGGSGNNNSGTPQVGGSDPVPAGSGNNSGAGGNSGGSSEKPQGSNDNSGGSGTSQAGNNDPAPAGGGNNGGNNGGGSGGNSGDSSEKPQGSNNDPAPTGGNINGGSKGASKAIRDSRLPKVFAKEVTAGRKSVTVSWKKLSGSRKKKISGIEIQYSLKKSFPQKKKLTGSRIIKKTAGSAKIKKLRSKKTYWVRMRTFKKVNGVKHVGKWSKVKKIRTK